MLFNQLHCETSSYWSTNELSGNVCFISVKFSICFIPFTVRC